MAQRCLALHIGSLYMKVEVPRNITRVFIKGYTLSIHKRDPEGYFSKGLVLSFLVIPKTGPSDVKMEFLVNA